MPGIMVVASSLSTAVHAFIRCIQLLEPPLHYDVLVVFWVRDLEVSDRSVRMTDMCIRQALENAFRKGEGNLTEDRPGS